MLDEIKKVEPDPLTNFLYQPESGAYHDAMSRLARRRRPCSEETHPPSSEREFGWQVECDQARAEMHARGFSGHDLHPLRSAALTGLAGHPREREILEVALLGAMETMGLNPQSAADVENAKQQL